MAGLQIKRDFALSGAVVNRPELSWSGVATLPSTVEVFVDNVRAWAGEVQQARLF